MTNQTTAICKQLHQLLRILYFGIVLTALVWKTFLGGFVINLIIPIVSRAYVFDDMIKVDVLVLVYLHTNRYDKKSTRKFKKLNLLFCLD